MAEKQIYSDCGSQYGDHSTITNPHYGPTYKVTTKTYNVTTKTMLNPADVQLDEKTQSSASHFSPTSANATAIADNISEFDIVTLQSSLRKICTEYKSNQEELVKIQTTIAEKTEAEDFSTIETNFQQQEQIQKRLDDMKPSIIKSCNAISCKLLAHYNSLNTLQQSLFLESDNLKNITDLCDNFIKDIDEDCFKLLKYKVCKLVIAGSSNLLVQLGTLGTIGNSQEIATCKRVVEAYETAMMMG